MTLEKIDSFCRGKKRPKLSFSEIDQFLTRGLVRNQPSFVDWTSKMETQFLTRVPIPDKERPDATPLTGFDLCRTS